MTNSARLPVRPRHRRDLRVVTTAIAAFAIGAAVSAIVPHLTAHRPIVPGPAAPGGAARASQLAAVSGCPDVDVVFARGTGEPPGLGQTGTVFADALRADLPWRTVSTYAVRYDASLSQADVGAGAASMSRHIIALAGQCPQTRFVIGGYSQGASVVDVAIGIVPTLGQVTTIPASLARQVAAVVVFGNPLGDLGQTIASLSPLYGPKSDSFCNAGDPVCDRGTDLEAHLAYATDGSAVSGARFAAERVTASS
jgi:cutinase